MAFLEFELFKQFCFRSKLVVRRLRTIQVEVDFSRCNDKTRKTGWHLYSKRGTQLSTVAQAGPFGAKSVVLNEKGSPESLTTKGLLRLVADLTVD